MAIGEVLVSSMDQEFGVIYWRKLIQRGGTTMAMERFSNLVLKDGELSRRTRERVKLSGWTVNNVIVGLERLKCVVCKLYQ